MIPNSVAVLRCATIVFRDSEVLLVHRPERGGWVLPGGRPRPWEGTLACARREVREVTGLEVDPGRCAFVFVFETIDPTNTDRIIELVFLSPDRPGEAPRNIEPGLEPRFVGLSQLGALHLQPPLGGHIRGLHAQPVPSTAPYLGNLWRPADQVGDR
jgi:8-oxo-dGTP pyrophosphatase MutT (NUDIX family)